MTAKPLNGLLLLCLTVFWGCSSKPPVHPSIIIQHIPAFLTKSTPIPPIQGTQNLDLLEYTLSLHSALQQCNADKSAIASMQKD